MNASAQCVLLQVKSFGMLMTINGTFGEISDQTDNEAAYQGSLLDWGNARLSSIFLTLK